MVQRYAFIGIRTCFSAFFSFLCHGHTFGTVIALFCLARAVSAYRETPEKASDTLAKNPVWSTPGGMYRKSRADILAENDCQTLKKKQNT